MDGAGAEAGRFQSRINGGDTVGPFVPTFAAVGDSGALNAVPLFRITSAEEKKSAPVLMSRGEDAWQNLRMRNRLLLQVIWQGIFLQPTTWSVPCGRRCLHY